MEPSPTSAKRNSSASCRCENNLNSMETRTQLNPIRDGAAFPRRSLPSSPASAARPFTRSKPATTFRTPPSLCSSRRFLRFASRICSRWSPSSRPLEADYVDLLNSDAARKGQPVQICRVGAHSIGVVSSTQPLMLPVADGVIVETSKHRSRRAAFRRRDRRC